MRQRVGKRKRPRAMKDEAKKKEKKKSKRHVRMEINSKREEKYIDRWKEKWICTKREREGERENKKTKGP